MKAQCTVYTHLVGLGGFVELLSSSMVLFGFVSCVQLGSELLDQSLEQKAAMSQNTQHFCKVPPAYTDLTAKRSKGNTSSPHNNTVGRFGLHDGQKKKKKRSWRFARIGSRRTEREHVYFSHTSQLSTTRDTGTFRCRSMRLLPHNARAGLGLSVWLLCRVGRRQTSAWSHFIVGECCNRQTFNTGSGSQHRCVKTDIWEVECKDQYVL